MRHASQLSEAGQLVSEAGQSAQCGSEARHRRVASTSLQRTLFTAVHNPVWAYITNSAVRRSFHAPTVAAKHVQA